VLENALQQAFVYLKRKYGIRPKDVDKYAVNFDPKSYPIDHRQGG
jgi:carbamoyltransferase